LVEKFGVVLVLEQTDIPASDARNRNVQPDYERRPQGRNPFVKTGFGFNHETGFGSLLQMDWTVCLLAVINI